MTKNIMDGLLVLQSRHKTNQGSNSVSQEGDLKEYHIISLSNLDLMYIGNRYVLNTIVSLNRSSSPQRTVYPLPLVN